MRGITLDEITESTKISRRHLEALEGEHFDQLPGGVFNKGFVRAYARFLGIDEDRAVADYSAASNEQPESENKFPLEIHEQPNRRLNPRRSNLPLVFAVAALIGVLVGYGFWVKYKAHNPVPAENAQQSASASAASETQSNGANPQSATSSTSPESTNDSAPAAKQAPAQVAAAERRRQAVPAESPAAGNAFSVQIVAKEDSWVSIVADGKSVM
ncbi:MAG: helix-turn-helix domain-containing protein, partial [Candidatus Angelobacter sp.]